MRRIRCGLPAECFVEAAQQLRVSQELLATKLGLVSRTLKRKRKAHENLSAQESERVMRVWQRARTLFRSDEAIAEWLLRPTAALDQAAPWICWIPMSAPSRATAREDDHS